MSTRSIVTVSTPAASHDLVALSEIKSELGITATTDDAWLTKQISRSSRAIEQFCNRAFVAEGITETFYPFRDALPYVIPGGVSPLQLSRWPLLGVTSVTENETLLVVDADYLIDAARGQLQRLQGGYPSRWAPQPIAVVYTAGYTAVPDDVQDACIKTVKARWFARTRDPMVRSEQVEGVGRTDYWVATGNDAGNLPPDAADILNNYRVPVLA